MGTKEPKGTAPVTMDRLRKKQPRIRVVEIVLNDEIADAYYTLNREIEQERVGIKQLAGIVDVSDRQEALDRKVAKLAALRAEFADEIAAMRFEAIGRTAFEALVDEHPPTPEQKARAKEADEPAPEWNVDTFPVAAVGASCKSPDLSVGSYVDEDSGLTRFPLAEELFDEWNVGELQALSLAAIEVNTNRRVVNLGEG